MKPRHTTDWFVPVHSLGDIAAPRIGRLPDGRRVGIAFTTLANLRRASGARQEWMRLTEESLRETLAALGVTRIQLDPSLLQPAYPAESALVH